MSPVQYDEDMEVDLANEEQSTDPVNMDSVELKQRNNVTSPCPCQSGISSQTRTMLDHTGGPLSMLSDLLLHSMNIGAKLESIEQEVEESPLGKKSALKVRFGRG